MSVRTVVPEPANPVLVKHRAMRAASLQNRIADAVTRFAGSMVFVYVHNVWFSVWIGFHLEKFPYGLLTMMVSLEAIFLSTFVMISQNRADERRQLLADDQWRLVQTEETQNEDLLRVSQQLLELTTKVHALTTAVHQAVVVASPAALHGTDGGTDGGTDEQPRA